MQEDNHITGVITIKQTYICKNVILACGGLGYKNLGASGDGYKFAKKFNHTIVKPYPAMMPLFVQEDWVQYCTADTVPKVSMYVNIKKYKKLKATGDLIFTKKGIRGPIVLDFAREITPLFDKYETIPVVVNLLKDKNESDLIEFLKVQVHTNPHKTVLEHLEKLLAKNVVLQLSKLIDIDCNVTYKNIQSDKKNLFFKILCNTPLTISGHDGFRLVMITRGGVSLNQIDANTMQSKIVKGLYFCGEVIDIDGPCGGYNLQWAFSSGYLAGQVIV